MAISPQNIKSVERYYRSRSRRYAAQFGRLHPRLVDTIFRYNKRDWRGRYVATLAGPRPLPNGVSPQQRIACLEGQEA